MVMGVEENVRKEGRIFGLGRPGRGRAGEGGEPLAIRTQLRIIDERTLARESAGLDDVVMIVEPRIAVEARMHPGQMIALAVILDRELPISPQVEAGR